MTSTFIRVVSSKALWFWGILPTATTWALIPYIDLPANFDTQRVNPIHLLLYQFEGSSMLIEFSTISIKHNGIIIWNLVIDQSSFPLEEVVEIKNASSKKVQQWRKACRDVKACKERERMNLLSFEKNDFVY